MNLADIAGEINSRSTRYNVGSLQEIRKEIGNLSRLPSKQLFDQRTVFEEWGWHYGGRKELQFNIGIEGKQFRFGVAFSLERSQSLPSIDVLLPKIALFNEYLSEHTERFSDLRMWHYQGKRSQDYMPSPIPPELIHDGVFIFLGGKQDKENLDFEIILQTLDRLLPLYMYTESFKVSPKSKATIPTFLFKPGCSIKPSSTSGSIAERTLDILLRHNDMQHALFKKLAAEHGNDNVGEEANTGGNRVDLVVKRDDGYWFYEIKVASSARACIRQALGQILEYSYWPGHQQASKLVIVGEPKPTSEEIQYIDFLRKTFSIPIEYQQLEVNRYVK